MPSSSGVDRTMIAMDPGVDRTTLAAPMPLGLGDPTVPIDVGPPRAARDATMMLPDAPPLSRPPGPVDRTVIASTDDVRPAPPRAPAQEAWRPPPSVGQTQPVAIDPSASSLAPSIARPKSSNAGVVVAIVAVVLIGVLGVGGVFAYPRVRAWIASRSDTPAEPVADADAPEETPVAEDTPAETKVDDAPPPDTKVDDAPPPDTKVDDAPPPDTKVDDAPPPDTKVDDVPPPDTKADDTPPPDAKVDDAPSPDTKADDTPPPDTKADDTPPPDTKADDTPPPDTKTDPKKTTKKKKKGKTPRDPTVPDFRPGPFVPP
jgi:hypothetical protein